MWQKLLNGPWVDSDNLLPEPVQRQAAQKINVYWRARGWQLVLGELLLWAVAAYQQLPYQHLYGALAMCIALVYLFGFFTEWALIWLSSILALLLIQGMIISGLGAVTALAFIIPYTFAGMLFTGRRRVWIQGACIATFWISLLYEALPVLRQVHPPNHILVSYNILLGAFVFQTLQFLNHLAVEINSAYVAEQMRVQSQQFLARVSHELRTPLNSILGFAKLLKRGEFTETQQHYLGQIIDEGTQLNRLVSDLLDSAHLNTGKVTLNRESCDVNAICAAVAEEQRPTMPAGVALRVELDPTLPTIEADKVRLRQVIANLVTNAGKYTTAGEIVIRTSHRTDALSIDVRDTGIGIPPEQQELVFVPFVQLDSRRIGVGLGLDIARQLVRLHGGDIYLQSTPGQGSTFSVQIPLQQITELHNHRSDHR
ncbi:MAG: HAMP domain-containing sensor histidine kinase [Anaerolineae bacterium]